MSITVPARLVTGETGVLWIPPRMDAISMTDRDIETLAEAIVEGVES